MPSQFYIDIYELVKLIPKGKVTSYGMIAKYLGATRSSRVVGWALNNSHKIDQDIPAHRVVNRIGVLSGRHHFETPDTMANKLKEEGHKIKNDQIVNFDQVLWDPFKELG